MPPSPRIDQLSVKNLRSIGDRIVLRFPERGPLVLLGENNAGKSNLTRALDILFGEQWPGTRTLDDHDYHGRDSDGIEVKVGALVSGMPCPYCGGAVKYMSWLCDTSARSDDGSPVAYRFSCGTCAKTWPNRAMQRTLTAIRLDADRRLDYQLSYASKYTMLSKLMHRFHERLLDNPERRVRLAEHFATLVAEFGAVPEFTDFQRLLSETADAFGQNLPYRLGIDFSAYDPSNFFRSLRVHPAMSGEVRSFDELGTGQSQILALAFAYAYARTFGAEEGLILVIDEPESNLHPLAQQWLAAQLNGVATDGVQVVLTTHSPYFVDLAHPETIALVSKPDGVATRVVQKTSQELCAELVSKGSEPTRTRPETVGSFYASSATTEMISGLFARRCILVEGPTEALALPQLLKKFGYDLLREGVAVVSAEGVGNIAKWVRLYNTFGIETYCVFDTDSDKVGTEAAKLLRQREDIMAALGLAATSADIVSTPDRPVQSQEFYTTLDSNFERAMSVLFTDQWAALYEEGKPVVGESKPLLARYVMEHLDASIVDPSTSAVVHEFARRILRTPTVPEPIQSDEGDLASNPVEATPI